MFWSSRTALVAKVKASRKKEGANEIRIPGERATESRKEAESSGLVEVDDAIMRELGYVT